MFRIALKFKKLNQYGQTSVEYILLLAAMITIITSILTSVKDRLIANQDSCPPTNQSMGCAITRGVSSFGASPGNDPDNPTFRFFTLRR